MIKLGLKMNRIEKIGIGVSEIEIESNRAVGESLQLYTASIKEESNKVQGIVVN